MPTTNEDRPSGIPWDGPPEPCILRYEVHNRETDAWEPLTTLDVLDRFYVDSVRVLVAAGTYREWMSLARFLENGGTLPDGPPKPIDYRERVNPSESPAATLW